MRKLLAVAVPLLGQFGNGAGIGGAVLPGSVATGVRRRAGCRKARDNAMITAVFFRSHVEPRHSRDIKCLL